MKLNNGFRPKHCTEYAALELVDLIINHMDKNEVPINIFLDLSKAFDTIDHNILLHKLRFYVLDGSTVFLFESYLSNRRQYVEIDEMLSETLLVKIGVPQGSILGPLLFTIYINDFPQVSNIFNFIMYADDTTLSSTLNQFTDSTQHKNKSVESLINYELGKVIEWLNINKLSLNKEISKYMIFNVPRKETQTLTLKIDNINIEQVDELNFLGLTLGANVTWKKHINKIANKCSKTTGVLNKLKHLLPLDIKTLLYNSLILSHINYCITVWGYKGSRILRIQKKAVRIITLNRYNSHTEPLFKTLQILKIDDQLKLQELKFFYKYSHDNVPVYLLNWNIIPNYNIHSHDTRKATNIHTSMIRHEFAKKSLKYNLPHIINDTPELVLEKNGYSQFTWVCVLLKNVSLTKISKHMYNI